jgi:ribonuclease HII
MKDIIGIDEVGRGPIAGPVAVGAFTCSPSFFSTIEIDTPLRDSKKLTQKQREKWFEYLKDQKEKGNCNFAVSMVSSEWIDKVGIVRAIKKALEQSLRKLSLQPDACFVYLDGGLTAPEEYINQETIIKGDELHPVISCASIVAKVSRDNLMSNYVAQYPEYGFENHVGYGTKEHYKAIKKYGITVLHRKTFLSK